MELLGKSLEELFQERQKKFSIKTVCMVGIQMLDRLEFMHNKNIIHRDIKPDNFVVGLDDKSHIIYALDFGLSKKFRSSRTHQHIKFNVNKKLTGTARYASINALKGCEQSRRDDLEAIGYVLLYFLRGSLPWQGLHVHKGEDRYKKILTKKRSTSAEELCFGFPSEFADYINYTRNLEFEADPDYKYLRGLLLTILEKEKAKYDFYYDWLSKKPVITDNIAVERYINNNTNVSFEIKGDDKKEKESEGKKGEKEEENMTISKLDTLSNSSDKKEHGQYSYEAQKTSNAVNNLPISGEGENEGNEHKKEHGDKRESKKSKKKEKKDKDKKCIIF